MLQTNENPWIDSPTEEGLWRMKFPNGHEVLVEVEQRHENWYYTSLEADTRFKVVEGYQWQKMTDEEELQYWLH